MCMSNILPTSSVAYSSVPVHGVTHLGFRSYPTGSSALETITTTLSFFRSDKPVYTTVSIRPISSWQDLSFSPLESLSYLSRRSLRSLRTPLRISTVWKNTTVVPYINKQGGTHSHTLLRLVVDLFLWLSMA